jgi:phosphoglycolate phosphatase
MKYNRVIWDFNGTILDDLRVIIDSADELLSRHGLQPMLTVEKYHSVFGFPIIEYYKRIGFDFNKTPYSVLAHEWVDIYLRRVKEAKVKDEIRAVIDTLSQMSIKQTVLSMTDKDMLVSQLKDLGLYDTFDEIYGLDNIYAKSKLELAKKWRDEHPDENVLFIGDTVHDAESAEIIGCSCLLLAGGHQSLEAISQGSAKVIIDPQDIIKEINRR